MGLSLRPRRAVSKLRDRLSAAWGRFGTSSVIQRPGGGKGVGKCFRSPVEFSAYFSFDIPPFVCIFFRL